MVHAAWDTMRDREFVREPYVAVEVLIDLQTKFVISQTKLLVLQTNFVCMTDHKLENMRQAFGRGGGHLGAHRRTLGPHVAVALKRVTKIGCE